jgi:hypothetical protein
MYGMEAFYVYKKALEQRKIIFGGMVIGCGLTLPGPPAFSSPSPHK